MAVYGNMVITQQGADLYGKVQTGTTLTFTRMQVGSGQFQSSAQLSGALASGTAYTNLSVAALTGAIASGSTITIGTGGTTQTVTTSAYAAIGDTTISVNSFTANAAYTIGAPLAITLYQSGMTALITPVSYFNINSISNSDGTVNIRSIFENTDLSSSTYTCEIGLLAQDPDLGEILYGYANAGTQGDTIPPYADGPYSRQFTVSIAIGNATTVSANIPLGTYVLASSVGADGGVASLDNSGNVPESQLGNVPLPANATTTNPGLLQASAVPTSGPPIAITQSDANWETLTGGTSSVADSEHTHQNFPEAVTFAAGANVPSGETLTVAGTETVTGTLEASGSGVINATELGGQPASDYPLITQANTFQGIQTAPAFAVSGITGTSAGRLLGTVTGGAPTSGTFQAGDVAVEDDWQNPSVWVYTQPASGSGTVNATKTGNFSPASGCTSTQTLQVSQPTTISSVTLNVNTAAGNVAVAIFNSSGTNLSGFTTQVAASTGLMTFNLPTSVTLQPNTTYYIALYTSSDPTVSCGANTTLSTSLGTTITVGGNGLGYETSGEGWPGTGTSFTQPSPIGFGFTYTVNVPSQWQQAGITGYEFVVATLLGANGYNSSSMNSPNTTAENPLSSSDGVYIQTANGSSEGGFPPRQTIGQVSPSITYLFETVGSASSGYTGYAGLWDLTANSLVSGSVVSTTVSAADNMMPIRSGPIALIAGHTYAPTVWSSSSGYSGNIYAARIVGQV